MAPDTSLDMAWNAAMDRLKKRPTLQPADAAYNVILAKIQEPEDLTPRT